MLLKTSIHQPIDLKMFFESEMCHIDCIIGGVFTVKIGRIFFICCKRYSLEIVQYVVYKSYFYSPHTLRRERERERNCGEYPSYVGLCRVRAWQGIMCIVNLHDILLFCRLLQNRNAASNPADDCSTFHFQH